MILKLDEKTVFIAHFHHQNIGKRMKQPVKMSTVVRPNSFKRWSHITVCTIHLAPCASKERPCGTVGGVSGVARCSQLDNFVKAKGRKLSFTRAIAHMDRETRTKLWEQYLEREGIVAKEVAA